MRKVNILYVEDEPFLGKIVKESLESRNFVVKMVADGKDALPTFEQWKPDICVLDVMLPNKDGFSIGKEIRSINPSIPIIFLTAKTQTEDLVRGFDSGGNDYIRKPFSMEELIVRIHNLLQLTQSSNKKNREELTIGKYQFFPQKYELHFGDQVKKLSHREAQLLTILADNQNNSIPRKYILKEVWGDDSFFNSRNLDVYITKLRDYLKEDPSIQIITLKGTGYHFTVG